MGHCQSCRHPDQEKDEIKPQEYESKKIEVITLELKDEVTMPNLAMPRAIEKAVGDRSQTPENSPQGTTPICSIATPHANGLAFEIAAEENNQVFPSACCEKAVSDDKLGHHQEKFDNIQHLCREARIVEAAAKLKELEKDIASAESHSRPHEASPLSAVASSELHQLRERLSTDVMLKKLRLIQPRIDAQLQPDGLLSVAQRKAKNEWIVGQVDDPSIGEHFKLEIKVRWLEDHEYIPHGGTCQFLLCATASGWPQPPQDYASLLRETDLVSKDWVQDCTEFSGTPGGPEELMSAACRYVIRPALCPISLEFCLTKELAVIRDGSIQGYPAGLLVVEQEMPSGVSNFEGWPVPPAKFGYKRMTQCLVSHISPDPDHSGCSSCKQVGRYGAPIPKWMTPLSLVHKVCLSIIHKTLKRLITGALPKWNELYEPRMQTTEVQDFYSAVASLEAK